MNILVLNSGSASLKFEVIALAADAKSASPSSGIREKRKATLPGTAYALPTRPWSLKIHWPSLSSTTNRTRSSGVLSFLGPTPLGGY